MLTTLILRITALGCLVAAIVTKAHDDDTWQLYAFLAIYARIMSNEKREDDL